MTYSPPDGFLTKQDVHTTYGISTRTVQRHISELLKAGDDQILSSLYLCTDDGDRWTGDVLTVELIEEVNRNGRKPRWYIDSSYALETFGDNGPKDKAFGTSQPEHTSTKRSGEPVPASDDTDNVLVLQERNRWLEKENATLKQQLEESAESKKADRDLQTQNVELLKELLKVFKGEDSLPGGTGRSIIVQDAEVLPSAPPATAKKTAAQGKAASTPKKRASTRAKGEGTKKQTRKTATKKTRSKKESPKTFWQKNIPSIFDRKS